MWKLLAWPWIYSGLSDRWKSSRCKSCW